MTPFTFFRTGTVILLLQLSAPAALVSLSPIADAFVTGGSAATGAGLPNANYGAAGALMVSPAGSTKGEIQSLLKFDLATAKASFDATFGAGNWLVDSIKLQLGTNFGTQSAQPNNAIFNSINAGLFKVDWLANDNWGEGTGNPGSVLIPINPPLDGVTFNSLGSLQSVSDRLLGTFLYTPAGNTAPPTIPPAVYTLGLDAGFVADVSGGNNVSFRAYAGDTGVGYLFNSRDFGTVANRPLLLVSASLVPEPGTSVMLVGTGLVWLARRRRHGQKG